MELFRMFRTAESARGGRVVACGRAAGEAGGECARKRLAKVVVHRLGGGASNWRI